MKIAGKLHDRVIGMTLNSLQEFLLEHEVRGIERNGHTLATLVLPLPMTLMVMRRAGGRGREGGREGGKEGRRERLCFFVLPFWFQVCSFIFVRGAHDARTHSEGSVFLSVPKLACSKFICSTVQMTQFT